MKKIFTALTACTLVCSAISVPVSAKGDTSMGNTVCSSDQNSVFTGKTAFKAYAKKGKNTEISYDELVEKRNALRGQYTNFNIVEAAVIDAESVIELTVTDKKYISQIKKYLLEHGETEETIEKYYSFVIGKQPAAAELSGKSEPVSDGVRYKEGLATINGLKYRFDENGVSMGLYTGWTKNSSTGVKNYYRDGKRVVGWSTIGGRKYYFFCESGAATGDVQIEDKICTFDENGVFTGKTSEPEIYAKNVDEVYYADDLPREIRVNAYYRSKNSGLVEFDNSPDNQCFNHIERYNTAKGKWETLEIDKNFRTIAKENGIELNFSGRGTVIEQTDDPEELLEDESFIYCDFYSGKLTAGKYRAVFYIKPASQGEHSSVAFPEFYSYFTVK